MSRYFSFAKLPALMAPVIALFLLIAGAAAASQNYTDKQLDALAMRVGKIFWLQPANGRSPLLLVSPAAGARSFRSEIYQSFEITELVGRAAKDPYYKIKLESGQVGYLRPEAFMDELNVTIWTADPQANEKKRAEQGAEQEQQRVEWINKQPWSAAVKQAAVKKQAVAGFTAGEAKMVLGEPSRRSKSHGRNTLAQERWYYADGSVLTFQNGLLVTFERQSDK